MHTQVHLSDSQPALDVLAAHTCSPPPGKRRDVRQENPLLTQVNNNFSVNNDFLC